MVGGPSDGDSSAAAEFKEPFVAVVHYSNVHFPYVYDEDHAPFQPSDMNKSAESNESFKNYYKNVVYLSDMAVGRLVRYPLTWLSERPESNRTQEIGSDD